MHGSMGIEPREASEHEFQETFVHNPTLNAGSACIVKSSQEDQASLPIESPPNPATKPAPSHAMDDISLAIGMTPSPSDGKNKIPSAEGVCVAVGSPNVASGEQFYFIPAASGSTEGNASPASTCSAVPKCLNCEQYKAQLVALETEVVILKESLSSCQGLMSTQHRVTRLTKEECLSNESDLRLERSRNTHLERKLSATRKELKYARKQNAQSGTSNHRTSSSQGSSGQTYHYHAYSNPKRSSTSSMHPERRISTPPPLTSIDNRDSEEEVIPASPPTYQPSGSRHHHQPQQQHHHHQQHQQQHQQLPYQDDFDHQAEQAAQLSNDAAQQSYLNNERSYTLAEMPREHADELQRFANNFKARRLELRLTQVQVGQAIGQMGMPDFAQSTISRFEKLMLSYENAMKLRPYIQKWMALEDADALSLCTSPSNSTAPEMPMAISTNGIVATPIPAHSQQITYRVVSNSSSPPLSNHMYSVAPQPQVVTTDFRRSPAMAVPVAAEPEVIMSSRYGHDSRYAHSGEPTGYASSKHATLVPYARHSHLSSTINTQPTHGSLVLMPALRRRKRRLVLTAATRNFLEETFQTRPRPTPEELSQLALRLELEKEEVRVWFCNRRQKEKRLSNAPSGRQDAAAGGFAPSGLVGTAAGESLSHHGALSVRHGDAHAVSDYDMSPGDDDVGNGDENQADDAEHRLYRSQLKDEPMGSSGDDN